MNNHAERAPGTVRTFPSRAKLQEASLLELATSTLERLEETETLTFSDERVLGCLAAEVAVRCQRTHNRFGPIASGLLLRMLRGHPDFSPAALQGANCLDVGCGSQNPLGRLLVLLLAGARSAVGIDLEPPQSVPRALIALLRAIEYALIGGYEPLVDRREVWSRLEGFDVARMSSGDTGGINHARLAFSQASADATGLQSDSIGVLTSNSFLEHVVDPDAVVAEFARICRPGAMVLHAVDYADHRSHSHFVDHPLAFLREAEGQEIAFGCNRVRHHTLAEVFDRHGFEILEARIRQRIDVTEEERQAFVEPYRSMSLEELAPLNVLYHLRKT